MNDLARTRRARRAVGTVAVALLMAVAGCDGSDDNDGGDSGPTNPPTSVPDPTQTALDGADASVDATTTPIGGATVLSPADITVGQTAFDKVGDSLLAL